MLYAIIMAGGAGTRFWPASRKRRPKQFLHLTSERSMLQMTFDRAVSFCPPERMLVMTNEQLVPLVQQQLPDLPEGAIVGEPCKRDTAPCLGLSAQLLLHRDPDAIMLVMPSDHVIQPVEQFQEAVTHALQLIEADGRRIVTFGIPPTYPAEVFGYIRRGQPIEAMPDVPAFHVYQFREKPDASTAKQYVQSGNYYWNAGIFVFRADTLLEALNRFEPEMGEQLKKIGRSLGTPQQTHTINECFQAIQGKSIDYAVLEHYEHVCVLEAPFQWDDVGNWTALPRYLRSDEFGNTSTGGTHLAIDSHDCIVRCEGTHVIVTVGMKECVVIQTPDATLVADRQNEQALAEIVKRLEANGLGEFI